MKTVVVSIFLLIATFSTFAVENIDTLRIRNLSEVVITGTNNPVSRNLLPYTVSTIGSNQLEATGNSRLLSAVSGLVPSLFVSERNYFGFGVSTGGSGAIKIRGVGGSPTNSVLMMVDGQPQYAGIYSHHIADFYETEYVDHVEVLRGPGSVLYGSNAMGGVINVITKNAPADKITTTLTSQYGSYNTWLTSLTNTTRIGRFSSIVSLGYDRTDGVTDGFDFKQATVYAKVGYDFTTHWNVKADYSFMQFVGNDPVYPKLKDPDSEDIYHQNIIRGDASVTLTDQFLSTNGALRIYYNYGNHFIDDPRHFHSSDTRFGVVAFQNFKPWNGADVTIGFDFDRYAGKIPISGGNYHTEGSLTTLSNKHNLEYSPYVTFSQDFASQLITINAGLRMANSELFGTNWIPQAGFVIHPFESFRVKASVARGYRNPSFRELYLYKSANPDLKSENMMNYEISVGKTFGHFFNVDITGYFCEGSDMIQTVNMKNVNTGSFRNKGIEISARSHPYRSLMIWATYSYLYTSLDNLTGAPKNQYYIGVGWDMFKNFHADAELKGVGGLYVADNVHNQNYATLNLRLSYQIVRQLQVFVNLDNVTAARYMINYGYKMPGFTAIGGFKLTL